MMSIQDFRYFKAIVIAGNLRKAAQSLHVSQPALSHSVKKLERHFGHSLLERRKWGVKPTSVGEKFFQKAEALLREWDALEKELLENDARPRGRVKMGCHPSVARYSLPHFLPELIEEYPGLEMTLFHDLSRNVTEAVNDGKIDLGIAVNPLPFPELVIRPLCEDEVTFWESPSNANKRVLIYEPNLAQSQWLLKKLSRKAVIFERFVESSSLEVIKDLAAAGCGVAILPARVARNSPRQNLKKLGHLAPPFLDRVCLVYRRNFAKTSAGRVLIDAILKAKI